MFFMDRVSREVEEEQSPASPSTTHSVLQSFKHYFRTTACYKQDLRKSLAYLLLLVSSGVVKKEGQLQPLYQSPSQHHITASQQGLSATDFCAEHAQWSPLALGLYPNLQLQLRATPAVGTTAERLIYWLCIPSCKENSEMNKKTRGIFNFYFLYCRHFLKRKIDPGGGGGVGILHTSFLRMCALILYCLVVKTC